MQYTAKPRYRPTAQRPPPMTEEDYDYIRSSPEGRVWMRVLISAFGVFEFAAKAIARKDMVERGRYFQRRAYLIPAYRPFGWKRVREEQESWYQVGRRGTKVLQKEMDEAEGFLLSNAADILCRTLGIETEVLHAALVRAKREVRKAKYGKPARDSDRQGTEAEVRGGTGEVQAGGG